MATYTSEDDVCSRILDDGICILEAIDVVEYIVLNIKISAKLCLM